jgi:hypothetical protein
MGKRVPPAGGPPSDRNKTKANGGGGGGGGAGVPGGDAGARAVDVISLEQANGFAMWRGYVCPRKPVRARPGRPQGGTGSRRGGAPGAAARQRLPHPDTSPLRIASPFLFRPCARHPNRS